MDRLGPFEQQPMIAVAVSGGADSMALARLASAWALSRHGCAVALTVDHGLRAESAAEAKLVGEWMEALGLSHRVLHWTCDKPVGGIQAAARRARYSLLLQWCRQSGVLHLLTAHHRDDQAETVLLRLGRGSGVDGLAAMAPIVEHRDARVLRPLLSIPRSRLIASLRTAGQSWIEDPTNADLRFGRARIRTMLAARESGDLTASGVASTAARLARTRSRLENVANALLATQVVLHPAGFALCGRQIFTEPEEIALRALSRLVTSVGGSTYGPRQERLERLFWAMGRGGGGWTLAGCRVLPRRDGFLFCREAGAVADPVPLEAGREVVWDCRFTTMVEGDLQGGLWLGALGAQGWREIVSRSPSLRRLAIPAAVRSGLPALLDELGVFAAPHLGYKRENGKPHSIVFRPSVALTVVRRCLV